MVARKNGGLPEHKWLLIGSVLLANLADLDFLPGLLLGDVRSFHHQATHSLAAVALVGLLVGGVSRRWKLNGLWWGFWAGSLYLSHLVLDFLVNDPSPPFGVQLLWPFSESYFISPITLFARFDYFDPAVGMLTPLLSFHNLGAMLQEIALMAPFLGLAWYLGQSHSEKYVQR